MASKKKKIDDEQNAPKILTGDDISIEDLFAKLKEFENKALLDRLKVLESSIAAIYKGQILEHNLLKEIKQHVVSISLAYEELLNNVATNEVATYHENEEPEEEVGTEKSEKKWN